jgi:hypothetical protein
MARTTGLAPPIQLRQAEVKRTARRGLLTRDHTSRSELAQGVWVNPKMLRSLACREPPIKTLVWFGELDSDTLRDPVGERIENGSCIKGGERVHADSLSAL